MSRFFVSCVYFITFLAVHVIAESDFEIPYIINGSIANDGDFPYMAFFKEVDVDFGCGASILTNKWILTAAQCCKGIPAGIVYTGSAHLKGNGTYTNISEVIVHPDFVYEPFFEHDICLLKLSNDLTFDSNTKPVVLVTVSDVIPAETPVVMTGWGIDPDLPQLDLPEQLRAVNLWTKPNSYCSDSLVPVFEGQTCVDSNGNHGGGCTYDNGDPLVTGNGTQIGIMSLIFVPCGEHPLYFTKVSNYLTWIKETMGEDSKFLLTL